MSTTSTGKEAEAAAEEEKPPVRVNHDGLEDIFLRLDAADLARAALTCTAFRGTITDPDFRRSFGRLHHPPPLVGFIEYEGPATLHPLLQPSTLFPRTLQPRSLHHVSTPAAGAIAKAADFACSFLPDPRSWRIRDSSSGRLLLSSRAGTDFRDLTVCDPLHSTYVRVPPVPDNLLLAGKNRRSALGWFPFLVPIIPASETEQPPLQVVWMLQGVNTVTAFVFSSTWGWEWRPIPAFACSMREYPLTLSYRLCTHGCFYWTSCQFRSHTALKLDIQEMRFSTMQLPSITQSLQRINFVVEAGEGDLGVLVVGNGRLDLLCRSSQGQGNDVSAAAADWRLNRRVFLPDDSLYYSIIGAADGYMLLQAFPLPVYPRQQRRQARYFSLKLRTLAFEELLVSFNEQLVFVHLYTNFPPLLSLPRVCSKEKTGQDQGEKGETSSAT